VPLYIVLNVLCVNNIHVLNM